MTSPIANRPASTDLKKVSDAPASNLTEKAGAVVETLASARDHYEAFSTVAEKAQQLATSRAGANVLGAVGGAVTEALRPGTLSPLSGRLAKMEGAVGMLAGTKLVKYAESAVRGAGIAGIVLDAGKTFHGSHADLGSSVAQAGASLAAGALMYVPGVGNALLIAELATGGGVSGGVKGLVAMGDAALTGDRTALEEWKKNAKSGAMGWAIQSFATGAAQKKLGAMTNVAAGVTRGAHALASW